MPDCIEVDDEWIAGEVRTSARNVAAGSRCSGFSCYIDDVRYLVSVERSTRQDRVAIEGAR